MELGILTVFSGTIIIFLGFLLWKTVEKQSATTDSVLDIVRTLTLPAKIPVVEQPEVVHSIEYMPEVELDEWMNGMGMVPLTGGWGPPGGEIPEEQLPPTEYPEP